MAAEAVSTQAEWAAGDCGVNGGLGRRQIVLQQFFIAPVMMAIRAKAAAAIAAPFVQKYGNALGSQGVGEGW
nr:hypothetical protein [Stenotrophomonas pictorum]